MMKYWWLAVLLSVGVAQAKPRILLSGDMPGKSFRGPLPAATAAQSKLALGLRADVTYLAVEIGERNSRRYAQLQKARDWVRDQLQLAGYKVRSQTYKIEDREYTNLECDLVGLTPEVVMVGAHYDSAINCPAANDNGTGVASLLALARQLKKRAQKPRKTLRLVAFVNEEPPNFARPTMGSQVYARFCRKRGDKIVSMLSLETMGYYSDQPGSQKYPLPLSLSYPSTGNFIAFVGDLESGPLVSYCVGAFRKHASFPSEGAALSGALEGVGWSDHASFWDIGVPAVMVTDTAPFRYAHYHLASDTPDKVDFGRLARVVEGLERVIWDLVSL